MEKRTLTLPVLAVGIISISFAAIFIKLIGDVNAVVIATWRLLISAVIVIPIGFLTLRKKLFEIIRLHWKVLFLSGFFLGVHFIFWIASLSYTSVASSVVIVCSDPVWVGVFSFLFLGERPTRNIIIGIVLTVLGGTIIGWGDFLLSPMALLGDALALTGAFLASGYLIMGRKIRANLSLLEYVTPVYSIAAVITLIIALFMDVDFFGYDLRIFALFFALAIIPQLIGHTSFNWALGHVPASIVAVSIVGEPLGSTILAYFILHEGLTSTKVIGGVFILVGIVIAMWRGKRQVEGVPI
jgi:drug/metabolite transporter (DMT)-like permease